MSRVGYRCFCILFALLTVSSGRAGARKRRRLILLLAVDWLPPSVRPSGACLVRGPRVSCSLFTPSRVAPHRGCVSAEAQSQWRENGGGTCNGLGLGAQRDLLGNSPHTRTPCPRDGDDDWVSVVPAGPQLPLAFT